MLSYQLLNFRCFAQWYVSSGDDYQRPELSNQFIFYFNHNLYRTQRMGNQICCEDSVGKNNDVIMIDVSRPGHSNKLQVPSKSDNKDLTTSPRVDPENKTYLFNPPVTVGVGGNQPTSQIISVVAQKVQQVDAPPMPEKIRQNYLRLKPFFSQFNMIKAKPRKYERNIYQGEVNNQGKPQGYGKMYYQDGSLLVGQFQKGQVQGLSYFFYPDGSYYQGKIVNNQANDLNALYYTDSFCYQGSMKNNEIDGQGRLTGKGFQFNGIFEKGKKKKGTYKWKQTQQTQLPLSSSRVEIDAQCEYTGEFDQNEKFTGIGTLKTHKGKYKGQFANGMKNGEGIFEYQNMLKYEGNYVNDVREGKGKLWTKNQTVAYEGDFKDGVPHGKGQVPTGNGTATTEWVYGVSKSVIEGT